MIEVGARHDIQTVAYAKTTATATATATATTTATAAAAASAAAAATTAAATSAAATGTTRRGRTKDTAAVRNSCVNDCKHQGRKQYMVQCSNKNKCVAGISYHRECIGKNLRDRLPNWKCSACVELENQANQLSTTPTP